MRTIATTNASVDLTDIIEELCEMGFMPPDSDDDTMPQWATDTRRGYDAIAHTTNGFVVCLESRSGDERFTAHLFTRNMLTMIRPLHFDATPMGVAVMLAALAEMVTA